MFSSVLLHDLVYSLFSLPLSLINVISHNVSEGFLLNCFLNVDGHQNFPRGRVCRELLVWSMCAYVALLYSIWMCSHVLCVYLCVCMYIPPCSCAWDHTCTAVKITSIFGASGPSGYWALQNGTPLKWFFLSKGHFLSRQNMVQNTSSDSQINKECCKTHGSMYLLSVLWHYSILLHLISLITNKEIKK